MRPRSMLYTEAQLRYIMSAWECKEPLPMKGEQLIVCWPKTGEPFQADVSVIERTDKRSDNGDRLWSVTQSSQEGRDFEASVQEAHVVAFRTHHIEQHRLAGLKRHAELLAQLP